MDISISIYTSIYIYIYISPSQCERDTGYGDSARGKDGHVVGRGGVGARLLRVEKERVEGV